MRNQDEFKAEVYRRSERKIHARKQKKKILLTCFPLVLCLLVASIVLAPKMLKREVPDQNTDLNVDAADQSWMNSSDQSLMEMESSSKAVEIRFLVNGEYVYVCHTDPVKVQELMNRINALASFVGETESNSAALKNFDERDTVEDTISQEYRITLRGEKTTVFLLQGNRLIQVETQEETLLNEEELLELKTALGLEESE